jgi:hypothetical protein
MKLPTSILLPFALAMSILPGPRGFTPATEVLTASGRLVDDASITGRVLDDHGQPVPGSLQTHAH